MNTPRLEPKSFPLGPILLAALFAQAVGVALLVAFTWGPREETGPDLRMKSREIAQAAYALCLRNLRQATDGLDNDGDGVADEGVEPGVDCLDPAVLVVLEGQLGRVGVSDWGPGRDANGNGLPDFGEPGVEPVPCLGGEMFAVAIFSQRDGRDNDGDGIVDEDDEAGTVEVVAGGRFLGDVTLVRARGELPVPEEGVWPPAAAEPGEIPGRPAPGGRAASPSGGAGAGEGGGALPVAAAAAACRFSGPSGAEAARELPPLGPFDWILGADGKVRDSRGAEIHDAGRDGPFRGWSSALDLWRFRGRGLPPSAVRGTYAVLGDAWIEGTGAAATVGAGPGEGTQVLEVSVIAAGEIRLTGNSRLQAARPDGILFAAGRDIRILGHEGLDQSCQGSFVARGKIYLAGRPEIRGSLVARDALGAGGLSLAPAGGAGRAAPPAPAPPPRPAGGRPRFEPRMVFYEER
ncbi:MAG: hypothetical protein MUC63_06610 [Planctomycetes bacterium]|jgi:hypothetical protein|nr:hypothetical protein [Planctomycetota bacterium]